MSARVVSGLAPAGKPHPTTKWSLLMALLVVVVLGVPKVATAGPPSVQAPTGAQSGGVFTGTYSFLTYIYCSGGPTYTSSYSNGLEGTHTFRFYGAADGSLLVTINGGGMLLVNSCGNPFGGPHTLVATYVVTKDSTPPAPTPTPPPPTPTPTPPPATGGGSSSGGSSGGGSYWTTGGYVTPTPTVAPTPAPGQPVPSATPTPKPTGGPVKAIGSVSKFAPGHSSAPENARLKLGYGLLGFALLDLILLLFLAVQWRRREGRFGSPFTPALLRLEPYWFRLRRILKRPIYFHGHHTPKHRGFSPHHHTGRLVAHHHTSYPALVFLLMVATVLAGAVSLTSQAATSESQLSLTVTGPPPATGATIDEPDDGDTFTTSNQTILGTCPSGLFVEIYRNATFAGSTICDSNGLFAVLITLVPGQNDLLARVSDALGQYGPDSSTVTVFYNPPPPPTPTPTPSPTATPAPTPTTATPRPAATPKPTAPSTLILESPRHFYPGASINNPVEWSITIKGGRPPYRVTWVWGDGGNDTTNHAAAGGISNHHIYSKPGTYKMTAHATDNLGQEAVIQVVVVVNGGAVTTGLTRPLDNPGLLLIWPILAVTTLMVISFWLGERHKLSTLKPTFTSG